MELRMNVPTTTQAKARTPVKAPRLRWWWLLPPALALFYPLAVRALYESGKLLHRAAGPGDSVA